MVTDTFRVVGCLVQCDLWSLQTLSDNTQISWDKCMTNKNYKEPNSIAQEIYDELDATEDGEVSPLPSRLTRPSFLTHASRRALLFLT